MTRSAWKWSLVVGTALAVVGLTEAPARAQVEPFRVSGGGPAPEGASVFGFDSPHSATGQATHLGKYAGDGVFKSLSFDPLTGAGTFRGTFTFAAKNGDKLVCTYGDTTNGAEQAGTYQVFPAAGGKVFVKFVAEFNPVKGQCTGRLRNVVDGSFVMIAVSEPFELSLDAEGFTPPFRYTWEGSGWLEFERGR
jgi:hypothetical protein